MYVHCACNCADLSVRFKMNMNIKLVAAENLVFSYFYLSETVNI